MKRIVNTIAFIAIAVACNPFTATADAGQCLPPAPAFKGKCTVPELPTRLPAAERIVAIGDLHGDLSQTRAVLKKAGIIDNKDAWVGGETVLVHTGDILDRGDDEPEIMALFQALKSEARAAGGAVHILNGNHELMNAAGDFRYVTEEGFSDYSDNASDVDTSAIKQCAEERRGRAAAFWPGGRAARQLAKNNTALVIGDILFVHGAIVPAYANALEQINRDIRCWLAGQGPMPDAAVSPDGPVWSRAFSTDAPDCDLLKEALSMAHVKKMVVGHTVQPDGIGYACDGRVWRIDVGMSEYYGGRVEALEITRSGMRILR